MIDAAPVTEHRSELPLSKKITDLLDRSTSLGLDFPDQEPANIKISRIIEHLMGGKQVPDTALPSPAEIAQIDEEISEKQLDPGFSSYLDLLREFVRSFIKLAAKKAGVTFSQEINAQIDSEFGNPTEKEWGPVLNQLLEAFRAKFPNVQSSVTPNNVLAVDTQTHIIAVGPAGNDGLSLDFFKKNQSATGEARTLSLDDTHISQKLEAGSVEIARYIKFLVQQITYDFHLKLFVNPADLRRAEEYKKLIDRFAAPGSAQLNPPVRRT